MFRTLEATLSHSRHQTLRLWSWHTANKIPLTYLNKNIKKYTCKWSLPHLRD